MTADGLRASEEGDKPERGCERRTAWGGAGNSGRDAWQGPSCRGDGV